LTTGEGCRIIGARKKLWQANGPKTDRESPDDWRRALVALDQKQRARKRAEFDAMPEISFWNGIKIYKIDALLKPLPVVETHQK